MNELPRDILGEIVDYVHVECLKALRLHKLFYTLATQKLSFTYGRFSFSANEVRILKIDSNYEYFRIYCPNVTNLKIWGCKIDMNELAKRVDLDKISTFSASYLSNGSKINLFKFTNLRHIKVDSSVIKTFDNIPDTIKSCSLSCISDTTIPNLPHLELLSLRQCAKIDERSMIKICNTVKTLLINTQHELWIKNINNVEDLTIEFYAKLGDVSNKMHNLRKLSIINLQPSICNIQNLLDIAPNIEYLRCFAVEFTSIKHLTKLKVLKIQHVVAKNIENDSVKHIFYDSKSEISWGKLPQLCKKIKTL